MWKKIKFDFDESAEPVAELHRYRAALSKRFKTAKALSDYIRSVPPADALLAELDKKIAGEARGRRSGSRRK